jgi:hypothetical protein
MLCIFPSGSHFATAHEAPILGGMGASPGSSSGQGTASGVAMLLRG